MPQDVRLLSSSGRRELDRRSLDAVTRSRFAPQPRRGCHYFYFSRGLKIAEAPPAPEAAAYRPGRSTCPADWGWASMPQLVYPRAFHRRHIEGWAVVRYDLAPSGEVLGATVAAAEPAAAFGEEALRIVARARAPVSGKGLSGCASRVIFHFPDSEDVVDRTFTTAVSGGFTLTR